MFRGLASLRRSAYLVLIAGVGLVLFITGSQSLEQIPRTTVLLEMQVALPRFIQVTMSAGDRYLAANLAGFRALVASTERMNEDSFRIQGVVQSDAAWLNPAHEDNYYVAAAMLPWNGQVEAGQYVLRQAIDGRPFDPLPPFFYGFNAFYFMKDGREASRWASVAAERAPSMVGRLSFSSLAARWLERGYDSRTAARMLEDMAAAADHRGFRSHLQKRAARMHGLADLAEAAAAYQMKFGRAPARLNDLVAGGVISRLPEDPFGFGYGLTESGQPILYNRKPKQPTR